MMRINADIHSLLSDAEDGSMDRGITCPTTVRVTTGNMRIFGRNEHFTKSQLCSPYRRNQPIIFPQYISMDKYKPPATTPNLRYKQLKVHETVELGGDLPVTEADRDGDFLRILHIIEEVATGEVFLRGWRFRRNSLMEGRLTSTRLNEVTMIVDVDADDERRPLQQGMETVHVSEVYRKRTLRITNALFPTHSFRDHTSYSSTASNAAEVKRRIRCSFELVCRWMRISTFDNCEKRLEFEGKMLKDFAETGKQRLHDNVTVRTIREAETDDGLGSLDRVILQNWTGAALSPGRPYTFGDICCGAGFASLGASLAGFVIRYAVDIDPNPCQTYRMNHPGTDVFCKDVSEFLDFIALDVHHVDVLHISFPCQFFSPAHTQTSANDDANTAASTALENLVLRIKPRIVTFEQTSGLLTHHPDWFALVIRQFTAAGYSVAWQLMNFAEYGLVQPRSRIVMFASCPGAALPPFPAPTHGPRSRGRREYVTIAEALAPLTDAEFAVTHHSPVAKFSREPYPAHTQLRYAVTCGGTESYHPSGTRRFTVREAVLLQGAPVWFLLPLHQTKTALMRQIGNGFPTEVVRVLLGAVRESLQEEDERLDAEWQADGFRGRVV